MINCLWEAFPYCLCIKFMRLCLLYSLDKYNLVVNPAEAPMSPGAVTATQWTITHIKNKFKAIGRFQQHEILVRWHFSFGNRLPLSVMEGQFPPATPVCALDCFSRKQCNGHFNNDWAAEANNLWKFQPSWQAQWVIKRKALNILSRRLLPWWLIFFLAQSLLMPPPHCAHSLVWRERREISAGPFL